MIRSSTAGISVPGSPDLRALADAAAVALADEDDSDSDSPKANVDPYLLDLLAEERIARTSAFKIDATLDKRLLEFRVR